MTMGKRENGYYWILLENKWRIAEYQNDSDFKGKWFLHGIEYPINENEISYVDERGIIGRNGYQDLEYCEFQKGLDREITPEELEEILSHKYLWK